MRLTLGEKSLIVVAAATIALGLAGIAPTRHTGSSADLTLVIDEPAAVSTTVADDCPYASEH